MTVPRVVVLFFPFRLDAQSSGQNSRGKWWTKAARIKKQREAVQWAWKAVKDQALFLEFPLVVTMIRVAPVEMDDDGVVGCFKGMRDEVAALLGFDDRSKACHWKYRQRKGKPGVRRTKTTGPKMAEYAIEIEMREAACERCKLLLRGRSEISRTETGFVCAGAQCEVSA